MNKDKLYQSTVRQVLAPKLRTTPFLQQSISTRMEQIKSMATQREKRHELKTIKQERNQKIREEINRQVCKDIVKRHQDKAKELWVQHKESIQKQSSPGPAEYST